VTSRREHGAGPGSNRAGQTMSAFLQQIHHTGLLRSTVAASDVATAVLCTLLLTIPRAEARNFLSAIPSTLRNLLYVCAAPRRVEAEVVGREQVLRTIADRLRIEPEGAELVARIVLAAAQNWLPRKQVEQLRLQLGPDLRDLWAPP
jgi:uncharacterized protein (DUF2267 family)